MFKVCLYRNPKPKTFHIISLNFQGDWNNKNPAEFVFFFFFPTIFFFSHIVNVRFFSAPWRERSKWTIFDCFLCLIYLSIAILVLSRTSPELVELSFNWPLLWLSSCPLFYMSLNYSVHDRLWHRVPDCLFSAQRLIVARQYVAH